jgi:hypothetical protein
MDTKEAIQRLRMLHLVAEDPEDKVAILMAIQALKQPEIIRCKDCVHSSGVKMVDGWTYCAEGRLLVKYEDGYCSDARRREE